MTNDNQKICYQAANTSTEIVASAYESQALSLAILLLRLEHTY